MVNPTINQSNNRLDGYTFDDAGNTKIDAISRQFIYDAENKQIEVKDAQSTSIGKYYYDGDGKRVKKVAGNEMTIFIYDAAGKLVAEYSNQTNANPQVSYLTSDHLGSPRINTDASGQVTARHDYLPFGEEITRASYGNDDVRKQFTGYEKDEETDLDFAQARYFNSGVGRFYSVDPENYGASEDDPQSWNGYAYVRNNPVILVDPYGLDYKVCHTNGQCFNYKNDEFESIYKQLGKEGFVLDGSKKNGNILNPDGSVLGTYSYFTTADQDAVAALTSDPNRTLEIFGPILRGYRDYVLPFFVLPAGGGGNVTGVLTQGNKVVAEIEGAITAITATGNAIKSSKSKIIEKTTEGVAEATRDFNKLAELGSAVRIQGKLKIVELKNGFIVKLRPSSDTRITLEIN